MCIFSLASSTVMAGFINVAERMEPAEQELLGILLGQGVEEGTARKGVRDLKREKSCEIILSSDCDAKNLFTTLSEKKHLKSHYLFLLDRRGTKVTLTVRSFA